MKKYMSNTIFFRSIRMNQLTGSCIMINKYISRVIPRDVVRSPSISLVVVPDIGTGDAAIPYLLTFTEARKSRGVF
jgi:hypothetical protein